MADQHGHAQILKTPSVADPAVFNPEVAHAQELFAETLGPEQVGVTLEGADDVVAVNLGQDPLLLGPDAGAVGPRGLADAGVEEFAPVPAVVFFQGGHIVLDVEEAARLGAVDDLVEGVGLGGGRVGVKWDVLGGEEVGVEIVVAAGLIANVLVSWAAWLGDYGLRWGRR